MSTRSYRRIVADGFWYNNPGLVQLLGLCPLLAISGTVVNALGLGLATTLTLVASNLSVSAIRNWVRPEIRIPVYVLIIASVVTAIELAMNAYFHELYLILGIFIPLIVTNCAIIGRAEAFASKNSMPRALVDALAMGLGFTAVLVALGGLREALGQGTLFAQAHLMFGDMARGLTLTLVEDYRGFLLAVLPPGAFIGLGLLLALKNAVDEHLERRAARRRTAMAEQPQT
ncbi:electron transport complex protein RnfE [Ectothiorhodospira mobilis]|uniref:Ion-translocating oxidoreductase complex subunit E n=1 Tax=Ectothiorhodospira mobilis TaxID=195064 RepID=A0A1I4PDT4_ECTMO|nr:electron transport complex subunit E [Ectothiorhodospira mobilis]SFM25775.1 electron transport complex protein RnfE [Ectothiorhodospira mobilis]